MKTIKMIAVLAAMAFMAVSCQNSDISEEESLFENEQSHDLTKIKKRT